MTDDNFFVSKSNADNIDIAGKILERKIGLNRTQAHLIGLKGDLGDGKTTWTKGLVEFLGGDANQVSSPTYIIMNEYLLGDNIYNFKKLYHLDLYRLDQKKELDSLRLNTVFSNPNALVVIEWFEKFKSIKPKTVISFETINDYTKTIELVS